MTRLVLLTILVLGCDRPAATGSQAPAPLDEATIDGTKLQIVAKDDGCVLKSGATELALQPKAPCFFLRRDGKIQQFRYQDVKVEWVVIIAGTTISAADRQSWKLTESEVCGKQSQAVLRKTAIRVSKSVHRGGVFCRNKGVDEKEFWSFAHEPD